MSNDLMAVLNVMAYGYEVSLSINGIDIGFKGGKSESTRLMGKDDPMVRELPPEMAHLACLKPGRNELVLDYRRLPGEDSTGLTVEIKSAAQFANDGHVFLHREDPAEGGDARKKTATFEL